MRTATKTLFLIFILSSGFSGLYGQSSLNSPYSSIGFGDLTFKGFGRNAAMGGITYGIRDNKTIDFSNPAAYTVRDSLSFIFEFGVAGKLSYYSKDDKRETPWDINFNHLAFSFPFGKRASFGAGLIPYSLINYQFVHFTQEGDEEYDPDIGALSYLFTGTGGLNQIFFGTGLQISRNISLGINVNYIFGKINNSQTISFMENPNAFNPRIEAEDVLSGFNFNTGIQYVANFANDLQLVIGGSYIFKSRLNRKSDILKTNILVSGSGVAIVDTLFNINVPGEKRNFPATLAFGASFSKGEKLLFGMDYKQVNWSQSNAMDLPDPLDSQSFHAGFEFTPNPRAQKMYLARIHYRMGGYYTKSFIQLYDNQINDFGITFGAGLPIGRSRSSLNFALDYGRRGTNYERLILENHVTFTFSLTLYDIWFMKRMYD